MEDHNIARIKEIKKYLALPSGEKKQTLTHFRPFRPSKNNLDKKVSHLLRKNSFGTINEKNNLLGEIKEGLLKISEIKMLPQAVLHLSYFSHFNCCHLLVHEKGKPVGQNFFNQFKEDDLSKIISVKSFNNIYNLVKKSKLKIFNQSETLKEDLDLVGNFLAKEIDLKNHSVVFLISRNSFLPPSTKEEEHFFLLCSFLSPLLNRLLNREKNDFKKDVLIKVLKNFPEKIYVRDHQHIIFTNDRNTSSKDDSSLISFPLGGNDGLVMELSNLSKDIISTEIYHSQRISLLGELLNTLQHELSNPLFGLDLTSSLLKHETKKTDAIETLNDICQNAIRSQTIIKNFSHLYNDQQEYKLINVLHLIEETITLTKSESKEIKKVIQSIGFNSEEDFMVKTNPTCLTQIIFNLVINASQAIKNWSPNPFKNNISISVVNCIHHIQISIVDDGPGVKNELSKEIFRPFFTTKESGTGLGLSICKNLATQINADINFHNNYPLPGATFSLNLPK